MEGRLEMRISQLLQSHVICFEGRSAEAAAAAGIGAAANGHGRRGGDGGGGRGGGRGIVVGDGGGQGSTQAAAATLPFQRRGPDLGGVPRDVGEGLERETEDVAVDAQERSAPAVSIDHRLALGARNLPAEMQFHRDVVREELVFGTDWRGKRRNGGQRKERTSGEGGMMRLRRL